MMNEAKRAQAGAQRTVERKVFDKPHLESEELLTKLQNQGMTVDATTALPYLREVDAYRMKGYWYQWQNPETKMFRPGTHFDQIIQRYEFDRALRRISADALERIELMVRATMSNVLSRHEGPHWFTKDAIFLPRLPKRTPPKFTLLTKVQEEVERMRDKQFIAHYLGKYNAPALPPSWAISECLSFGSWSHAYAYLANVSYRKQISRRFGVELPDVFASWLHAFSVLRNTVAHHGRLLGTQTSVTPRDYRDRGLVFSKHRTFFVTATAINYVCQRMVRGQCWKTELESLFSKFPSIPISDVLGFPLDWPERPGWRPTPVVAGKR
jgi:abortive infection bacteriophage resistance protein